MSMKLTVEHNGTTYDGQYATIKGTLLGEEDHGILTAYLFTEWPGGGIGVGGYALDQWDSEKSKRVTTAYGMDQVVQMMDVVGVSSWEKMTGKPVVVLFAKDGWTAVGIASVSSDKVLILADHANEWIN